MFDFGISELAVVGVVALVVIGPERLPRVARTVGTMLGKAQRYVADVKAEVNRSMELEELQKMKSTMEGAARDVEGTLRTAASGFEQEWSDVGDALSPDRLGLEGGGAYAGAAPLYPQYRHPRKKFRLKQQAVPKWFKVRTGMRTHVQSGAARVARFRPKSKPY